MSINSYMVDKVTETPAIITDDGEVCVISPGYPPLSQQKIKPFRQYLTDDGLSTGSNDMGVDGSSTNVDFYVIADPENDRYITTLNYIVGYGSSGQPNEWADGTALTNGTRLFYSNTLGNIDIHDGIKSNQDMFRLSNASVPTAWEVRHVNATNDYGYFMSVDLRMLGMPFGVKLERGTRQRLCSTVRDNAGTDADSFNCIAYGFDRFE